MIKRIAVKILRRLIVRIKTEIENTEHYEKIDSLEKEVQKVSDKIIKLNAEEFKLDVDVELLRKEKSKLLAQDALNPKEAVYAIIGLLSGLHKPVVFGENLVVNDDMLREIENFCETNNLSEPRENWGDRIVREKSETEGKIKTL